MRGWFDAFREGGGPTLYASQRIAATHDNILIGLYATFAALFLAFLLIIPGIRRNKVPTLVLLTASMFVLASIIICRFSPNWHVASSSILASYKRTTPQKLPGIIGVQIGLEFFNVTLQITEGNRSYESAAGSDYSSASDLQFNERYSWHEVEEVRKQYQESLERGLPYPILTVAEVLSMDAGSFAWGRSYRLAGYYAGIVLWSALASWALMNALFCLVPRYSGYFMLLTGGLLLACNTLYSNLLPAPGLTVRFEQGLLRFQYGWCFWMVLSAGLLCVVFGLGTLIVDYFFPQLLTEVHSSWRYTTRMPAPLPQPYSLCHDHRLRPASANVHLHKSESAPAAAIQIRPFQDLPLAQQHSLSAVNWTSDPQHPPPRTSLYRRQASTDSAPYMVGSVEEINRISNLPFTGASLAAETAGTLSRIQSEKVLQSPSGKMPVTRSLSTSADGGVPLQELRVTRDGRGYVDPVVTWDINVQEGTEEEDAGAGENTRL
ncbi:dual oxidase maturation factor 1-like [Paramacrobiotus metropolitanus]|uniref:dual oxidase maturation factor 1-like n=1 Tax=Paramacrobiotus metropolitanus TaxID=2943436 RepID=UPI002445F228|nr:dual oxidase maturation factor 1-like [Paramacrobiotus metropolitanus]XP_055352145.1 dual oxidase maturation factor 1-like [Paramacrobiotus metropolitanus]XP_055352146.1 dual oxidase maturation factor 1-like [Paramacrobiotus metropolitanus]